jgi:transposase InsO family protein/transposase-like protein
MKARSTRSPSARQLRLRRKAEARRVATAPAAADPRGRRFSPDEHEEALKLIVGGTLTRLKIAETLGTTTESLRRWYKEAKASGTLPAVGTPARLALAAPTLTTEQAPAGAATTATSSAPHDPGQGLADHEVKAILDHKKKHPSMGPAQIRAQLKRFLGWRLSVRAIAGVLKQHGFQLVHRGGRPVGDEHPLRFEAPCRNALWQLDFTELRVGPERRYLLVIEDDFSRFLVGHCLADGPTSEVAITTMREAIRRHGKPERVYTDRGAAFTAWRDVGAFERFLEEQLIDHSLRRAHHPQGGGKIEAVIATVQRELWEVVHFDSVVDAEQALARFVDDYNHRRAHLGIGGLTPADRFFGRWPEVAADLDAVSRRRQGALAVHEQHRLTHELLPAQDRALVLQLVLVEDHAELHFLGRRIVLGPVVA